MKNFRIYWGETLNAIVTIDDPDAVSATLTISTIPQIVKTDNFVNGEADVSVSAIETQLPLGKYEYQLKVVYGNGIIDKMPDISNCLDCSLPTVTIMASLDMPLVS